MYVLLSFIINRDNTRSKYVLADYFYLQQNKKKGEIRFIINRDNTRTKYVLADYFYLQQKKQRNSR
jgi:hypothetical protein